MTIVSHICGPVMTQSFFQPAATTLAYIVISTLGCPKFYESCPMVSASYVLRIRVPYFHIHGATGSPNGVTMKSILISWFQNWQERLNRTNIDEVTFRVAYKVKVRRFWFDLIFLAILQSGDTRWLWNLILGILVLTSNTTHMLLYFCARHLSRKSGHPIKQFLLRRPNQLVLVQRYFDRWPASCRPVQ